MSDEARPSFAFPTGLTVQQKKVRDLIRATPVGGTTAIGFGGAVGGGKLLALDTPVPTPSGWTTMGEIGDGSTIFGDDGQPCVVLKAHGVQLPEEAFRLTFDDGSVIDAGGEHLWFTYTYSDRSAMHRRTDEFRARRQASRPSRVSGRRSEAFTAAVTERNQRLHPPVKPPPTGAVRTTREIFDTLWARGTRQANHAIPVAAPLALPDTTLPLDPYLLGLWLGDGTTASGGFTTADPELVSAWEAAGWTVTRRPIPIEFYVRGLSVVLRSIGVLGNKHIPLAYLRGSAAQRLALLQGLMDTDGTVAANSGSAEFCTTRRTLAEGVHELICSLGMKCTLREGRARLRGRDCGPKFTIKWMSSLPAFRLSRKSALQTLPSRSTTRFRYIIGCEPIAPVPMRCITVDSPSGLFLAGRSFIPTHNTALLVRMAYELSILYPGNRGLVGRDEFNKLETTTLEMFDEMVPPDLVIRRNNAPPVYRDIRLAHWPDRNGKPFTDPKRQTPLYSRVYFRGLANWKSLGSEAFGFAFVDEASEVPDMAAVNLILRLRHRLPRFVEEALAKRDEGLRYIFLAASNPWPNTFFEKWFWRGEADEVVRATNGKVQVHFVPSRIRDNPYLPANYEETARAFLRASGHGLFADRMVDGRFDVFEGRVYEHFKPTDDGHRLPHLDSDLLKKDEQTKKPLYKAVYGGLDFGGESATSHYTAGCVAVMTWANRLIFVEGFKYRGPDVYPKQMAWMMAMQHKWAAPLGKKIHWCADGSQRVGINAWQEQGFWITPSERSPGSVEEGIKKVAARLEKDQAGIPGIKYLAAFTEFEEAMRRYARDPETMKIVKADDDMADCIRYTVEIVDQFGGDPNVLLRNNLAVVQ